MEGFSWLAALHQDPPWDHQIRKRSASGFLTVPLHSGGENPCRQAFCWTSLWKGTLTNHLLHLQSLYHPFFPVSLLWLWWGDADDSRHNLPVVSHHWQRNASLPCHVRSTRTVHLASGSRLDPAYFSNASKTDLVVCSTVASTCSQQLPPFSFPPGLHLLAKVQCHRHSSHLQNFNLKEGLKNCCHLIWAASLETSEQDDCLGMKLPSSHWAGQVYFQDQAPCARLSLRIKRFEGKTWKRVRGTVLPERWHLPPCRPFSPETRVERKISATLVVLDEIASLAHPRLITALNR